MPELTEITNQTPAAKVEETEPRIEDDDDDDSDTTIPELEDTGKCPPKPFKLSTTEIERYSQETLPLN